MNKQTKALDTSPQPSKPWVGLTEDEWDEIERIAPTVGDAIRMAQFKLRERNEHREKNA